MQIRDTLARLPFLAICALGAAESAQADANAIGRTIYLNHCATCHGNDGDGKGITSTYQGLAVPDLTELSAGGDFPRAHVIRVIDGSAEIRAHGSPMPAWGTEFERFFSRGLDNPEAEAQAWIATLADYLEDIQK